MVIKSYLLAIINENQENATFYENSSTRLIKIDSTEGSYIDWLIYHVSAYNDTTGGMNWDPFWIVPRDVNSSYPIYSITMNLTKRTELNPFDMPLFSTSRPLLIFNAIQNITTSYENITNTIGLIYDNITGILLKGVIDSVIVGTSATNHYYANFELHDSNTLEPANTSKTTTTTQPIIPPALQKPNYFLLTVILALPLLITIIRFLRLKEISGGTD